MHIGQISFAVNIALTDDIASARLLQLTDLEEHGC
jgi:hypothetical protein